MYKIRLVRVLATIAAALLPPSVFADADPVPLGVANLTWYAGGQTLSAASIVPTGTSGAISVYAGGATHVIIDINGYFLGSRGPKSMGSTTAGRANLVYLPPF